jgi:hypothetical protein
MLNTNAPPASPRDSSRRRRFRRICSRDVFRAAWSGAHSAEEFF